MAQSFFSTYLTGDVALDNKLTALKLNVRKKITRAALSKGGTVLVKSIKRQAPVGPTKNLKRSIGKSLKRTKNYVTKLDFQGLRVGPNVGRRTKNDNGRKVPHKNFAYHAHLVVLGTQERITKKGRSTGRMPQNDFVRRGARSAMPEANRLIKSELSKRIQKEANK